LPLIFSGQGFGGRAATGAGHPVQVMGDGRTLQASYFRMPYPGNALASKLLFSVFGEMFHG
jgi:hypothetical protein